MRAILIVFILTLAVLPVSSAQTKVTAPPIPEEARRHFVMGTTLFKDAKTPDDYEQVESQFKQAVDLAPQWPDPRYNLALTKEAAGDYSGALADLKIYQQFKLSDDDARKVQDKIYALEAKADEAAKKQAEQQDIERERQAAFDRNIGFLTGRWNVRHIMHYEYIDSRAGSYDSSVGIDRIYANIAINGDDIVISTFHYDGSVDTTVRGKIGVDRASITWESDHDTQVSISQDRSTIHIYRSQINGLTGQPTPNIEELIITR